MSLKRTAASAGLDVDTMQSPNKRARFTTVEELMFNGMLPLMSLPTCMKKAPDMMLVRSVKQILLTGVKSQKQVARECGLSQTKMSQFMNCAGRNKGWEVVERTVADWLANYKKHNNHSIDLQSDLACKVSPLTPVYSNIEVASIRNVYNPTTSFNNSCQPTPQQISFSYGKSAQISEVNPIPNNASSNQLPPSSSYQSFPAECQVVGSAADDFTNFDQNAIWAQEGCYEWEIMNSPDSWSDSCYSQVLEVSSSA